MIVGDQQMMRLRLAQWHAPVARRLANMLPPFARSGPPTPPCLAGIVASGAATGMRVVQASNFQPPPHPVAPLKAPFRREFIAAVALLGAPFIAPSGGVNTREGRNHGSIDSC